MKILLDAFSEGEIDKVYLASNSFVNTMTQEPEINQLLPLNKIEDEDDEGKTNKRPLDGIIFMSPMIQGFC